MANPTTNYSWPMPTSTDLVTDLPADFALFGQPVDTSLKALNPETTLGDIAYRSSTSNTNTRLGIGSTGQVLTVASGVPSWAAAGGGPTGAWTAYTPTVTAGTGSLTTVSATGFYYATGKLCIVRAHINLTTNGTGSGVLNCTMPFTAINDKNQVGTFREQVVTGLQGSVNLTLNTATAGLRYYDNTYPGANATQFCLSITYEVA